MNKKNTVIVEFYGGFHNSGSIGTVVPSINSFGKSIYDCDNLVEYLDTVLTDTQRANLEKFFCGIAGCTCGSWTRAMIRIIEWEKTQ